MNPFVKLKLMRMSPEDAFREGNHLYDTDQKNKAFPYFLHAAQKGHAGGQHMTAVCYSKGEGCATDPRKAQHWYELAAEQGNPKSQYLCAQSYGLNNGGIKDDKKSLYWYEKAARQAKPDQMFASASISACAVAYERGWGCEIDLEKALYWYEKNREIHLQAAEDWERKGSIHHMKGRKELAAGCHADVNRLRSVLGLDPEPFPLMEHETPAVIAKAEQLLKEGMAYLDQEPEKACDLLRQAAELRNPEAQYQCGQLLRYGKGCPKDMPAALRMLENAAEQDHLLAQRHLGMIYLYGKEYRQNRANAEIWLKKAAEQKDPEATYHLGLLEIHKWGGIEDTDKTEFYLRQALSLGYTQARETLDLMAYASRGESEAMYNLAMLIIEVGDRRDPSNKARLWLRRAEAKGHQGARQALATVARSFPH